MQDHSTLPLFSLQPETKEIPLSRGLVAIVDAADYEWLMQWKWHAKRSRHKWYAERNIRLLDGTRKHIAMHRQILGASRGLQIDHKNGDGLDNRRDNLRLATNMENCLNKSKHSNNTSGYKGVGWHKNNKRWYAQIQHKGKRIHLGSFGTAIDAAKAWDAAATELHGEFAFTNFEVNHE